MSGADREIASLATSPSVPIEVGPMVLRDGVWFADLTLRD
jgi:hypothetical protein